ncbi:arylsulfatase B-like [Glandiceps talaboti]
MIGFITNTVEGTESCSKESGEEDDKKPHIVLVVSCSNGWGDYSWHNPIMQTPVLESLAKEGVILNQTYVQTLCSPTRAALLTGYYPHRAGLGHITILTGSPTYLRRNFTTLAEVLKPLGYATHMVGKSQIDMRICIQQQKTQHYEFNGTSYDYVTFYIIGMMSMLDEAVGNLTDTLKAKNMWDNTLFIYINDHGTFPTHGRSWPLRGGAGTPFEGALRAVSFIHGNMLESTGYVNNELIHVTDFFPTLVSLAGGTPDPNLDGFNIWDTLSKGAPTPRTEMLQYLNNYEPSRGYAMRVGDYKLMDGIWMFLNSHPSIFDGYFINNRIDDWYPPADLQNPDIPDVPPLPSFNATLLFNIAERTFISEDPREINDLSATMPEKVEELRAAAKKYLDNAPPAFFQPGYSEESDPANFNGVWAPGWC